MRDLVELAVGCIGFVACLRWLMMIELRRMWQASFSRHSQDLRALQQRQALAQIAVSQAEERACGDRHGL